jgi:hypothetical protein
MLFISYARSDGTTTADRLYRKLVIRGLTRHGTTNVRSTLGVGQRGTPNGVFVPRQESTRLHLQKSDRALSTKRSPREFVEGWCITLPRMNGLMGVSSR